MKRLLPLLLCFLFTAGQALAQSVTGSLRGKVVTSEGTPAEGVTIQIKESTKGTITDDQGLFSFRRLSAGAHTLLISLTGYEKQEQEVNITAGQEASVSVVLKLNSRDLGEVIVNGGRKPVRESEYIARLPLKNIENPQVYNVVSKELMREQVVTNFDDAMKNAPGVNKLWSSTGRANDGAGYYSMRGFAVQPRLVNGLAGVSNGSPDPANIERIETIKGPSGTLFGSSLTSFGGLINIVTKKPYSKFGGEVAYTAGSYGLNRVTADINTPLDADKKILFRANAAYHQEASWQDAGFKKSIFFAPSVAYQVNEKLSLQLNTEFYNQEATNAPALFLTRVQKLKVFRPEDMGYDFSRSFASNDVTIRNPVVNVNAKATYRISRNWVSETNLSRSTRRSDGYYLYLSVLDTSVARQISNQKATNSGTGIQQNFIGDFHIGSLRNRMVVGLDFLSISNNNNSSPYITFDTVNFNRADPRYTALTKEALDQRMANAGPATKNSFVSNTYSAYASDVINVTDRLSAMLSLRVDHFDNRGTYDFRKDTTTGQYDQTTLSPKFGLVYEVLRNQLSVFGNYMNGFQNVSPVTQPDGSVSTFKPQQANQWEAGVKASLFDGRLSGSVSYYDIYVTNVTRPDPERTGFSVQDGNISSNGVEADVTASPLPGLNIVAGYGYNKSVNKKTDKNIVDRRPVSSGPEQVANLWISYTMRRTEFKGLGAGFGCNYAGENMVTNGAVTGVFTLPSYTVFNASIFYDRPAYRLSLKMDNIANKTYWGGWTTIETMMKRRVMASLALRF